MSLVGTAAISQRHHVGLQQLEVMAATASTFLGPNKRYKLIHEESSGESVLIQSCYRLLEHLELSGSVEQLVHETVKAQQGTLHSGTSSLLFLAGVWSRVALECLHQGIPIHFIMNCMSKGLELCVEACRQSALTLEEVVCKASSRQGRKEQSVNCENTAAAGFTCSASSKGLTPDTFKTKYLPLSSCCVYNTSILRPRIKLKHSRHFTSSECTDSSGPRTTETYAQHSKFEFDIVSLAKAVSNGCDTSTNLVIEASKIQSRHNREHHRFLDLDRMVTCPFPGLSEDNSRVLHGFVVLLSSEQISLVKRFQERILKIGLVSGDLSETYRHLGFNRPKNVTHVSNQSALSGVSCSEKWLDCALSILTKLCVDVLLVTEMVAPQLKDHCLGHNILVIEQIRTAILNNFATATGAIPVSYITQLSEHCVGAGVRVNLLEDRWGKSETGSALVNLAADGTMLVTAIISSTVCAKLQSLEDRFWDCAYQLHHALKDGKLLPGAGATELFCIHHLHQNMGRTQVQETADKPKSRPTEAAEHYEPMILGLMADGWMDYISTLWVNTGQVQSKAQAWTHITQEIKDCEKMKLGATVACAHLKPKDPTNRTILDNGREMVGVYDNMTVKFETWRRALDLVFLVLQTDTEIVIGVNKKETQLKDFMFL